MLTGERWPVGGFQYPGWIIPRDTGKKPRTSPVVSCVVGVGLPISVLCFCAVLHTSLPWVNAVLLVVGARTRACTVQVLPDVSFLPSVVRAFIIPSQLSFPVVVVWSVAVIGVVLPVLTSLSIAGVVSVVAAVAGSLVLSEAAIGVTLVAAIFYV